MWQTVLDALKPVVKCIYVGLWGKTGAAPFYDALFWWNGAASSSGEQRDKAILCDNHRKSKMPDQKTLVVPAVHWLHLMY